MLHVPRHQTFDKQTLEEKTRSARELLERWSTDAVLEPIVPAVTDKTHSESERPATSSDVDMPPSPKTSDVFEVDAPPDGATVHNEKATGGKVAVSRRSETSNSKTVTIHHHDSVPRPHVDVQRLIKTKSAPSSSWVSIAGQLLAYAGVLGLTAGTCLVLLSYFGGQSGYAPTGWLIAAAGQMLLFLGVVTLVSGGLEQTTQTFVREITELNDRLVRFEEAHRLSGPQTAVQEFDTRSSPSAPESPDKGVIIKQ